MTIFLSYIQSNILTTSWSWNLITMRKCISIVSFWSSYSFGFKLFELLVVFWWDFLSFSCFFQAFPLSKQHYEIINRLQVIFVCLIRSIFWIYDNFFWISKERKSDRFLYLLNVFFEISKRTSNSLLLIRKWSESRRKRIVGKSKIRKAFKWLFSSNRSNPIIKTIKEAIPIIIVALKLFS